MSDTRAKTDENKPKIEVRIPVTPPEPRKKYRLKQGQKHFLSTADGAVQLRSGQTAMLTDSQFAAFKDKFDPTEETADEIRQKAEKEAEEEYSLQEAGGKKFNVVKNATGAIENEEPLSEIDAKKLQKRLEAIED